MTETDERRPKNYRWALYCLIFLVGWLLGKERAKYEDIAYIGPDDAKAEKAMFSIVTSPKNAEGAEP